MKKLFSLYISLIIITFLSGCDDAFETTLEIDPPEHTPQLVVHAYASTSDGDINVQVDESKGILDNTTPQHISGATVSIWLGTDILAIIPEVADPFLFDFNYKLVDSDIQFVAGNQYRIEVEAPNYPKAIGICTVPSKVSIDQIRFELDGPATSDSDDNSEIEIDFKDIGGVKNYYELVPLIYEENGNGPSYFRETKAISFDPATEEGINYASLIINDLSFDGEDKNISVIIEQLTEDFVSEKLFVSWRSTTEDHYLFNRTARAQKNQGDNPFSSPVQIYSNMENGIGIFSIVNEDIIKVEL